MTFTSQTAYNRCLSLWGRGAYIAGCIPGGEGDTTPDVVAKRSGFSLRRIHAPSPPAPVRRPRLEMDLFPPRDGHLDRDGSWDPHRRVQQALEEHDDEGPHESDLAEYKRDGEVSIMLSEWFRDWDHQEVKGTMCTASREKNLLSQVSLPNLASNMTAEASEGFLSFENRVVDATKRVVDTTSARVEIDEEDEGWLILHGLEPFSSRQTSASDPAKTDTTPPSKNAPAFEETTAIEVYLPPVSTSRTEFPALDDKPESACANFTLLARSYAEAVASGGDDDCVSTSSYSFVEDDVSDTMSLFSSFSLTTPSLATDYAKHTCLMRTATNFKVEPLPEEAALDSFQNDYDIRKSFGARRLVHRLRCRENSSRHRPAKVQAQRMAQKAKSR